MSSLRIDFIGDGQLARMMILAAQRMGGVSTRVYGTNSASPAGLVADETFVAPYTDETAWPLFAESALVVTPEWENVPLGLLSYLQAHGAQVHPSPKVFGIASQRNQEKSFAQSLGITTAPYLFVADSGTTVEESVLAGYLPGIFKTCSGGYDGLGQTAVTTLAEFEQAKAGITVPHLFEKRLDFAFEISVVGVRSRGGDIRFYPAVRNEHQGGILRKTYVGRVPGEEGRAHIPDMVRYQANSVARRLLEALDYVGVLGVEMFVMPDDSLVFNEMAPRVHNSGHWTIEGCRTSQFENHVRAVMGLPLESIQPLCRGAVMDNLLGDAITPYREGKPLLPNQHFHDYHKSEIRPPRKMGHVTTIYR